jgi:putative Ca2+/H+ antiporter (TMEM165/GDT1 family)
VQVVETFVPAMSSWPGRWSSLRPGEKGRPDAAIAVAVFPIIFLGELPDKTICASLIMATRGKLCIRVWD